MRKSKEPWIYFIHNDKILASYTLFGTFAGEAKATVELLAGEKGISPQDIQIVVTCEKLRAKAV